MKGSKSTNATQEHLDHDRRKRSRRKTVRSFSSLSFPLQLTDCVKAKSQIPRKEQKLLEGSWPTDGVLQPSELRQRYCITAYAIPVEMGYESESDARTICSFSTNATVDNNPGTGRTLDKLYQSLGRKLEQFILKIRMRTEPVHPNILLKSLLSRTLTSMRWLIFYIQPPTKYTVKDLSDDGHSGYATIAGILSLIRQTQ